jgi:heme/copper-type cytochrome/quinol oxidase subunit 1
MLVAIVIYLVCRTAARFVVEASPLALPELLAGVVIGVAVFQCGRRERSPWNRWLRRIEAMFFLGGLVLTSFLQIVGGEGHLNDTLLPVAATHLEAFVLLFAVLRSLDGAASSRIGWTGFVLATLGGTLFGCGCMVLGSRGMPRRYAAYLPEFASVQIIASVGSLVLSGALLMVVIAHTAAPGRRRSKAGSSAAQAAP